MEDNNVISLGEWNLPKSWKDITLKQFQEIKRHYDGKEKNVDVRDILHILTNHTIDEVNELPIEFTEKMLEQLTFLQEEPNIEDARPYVDIKGTRYAVNIQNKLKTGEYLSVNQVLKDDKDNLALMLAILCRKDNEPYDSHFENEVIQERVEMFENTPVFEVMPIINFFLNCWLVSEIPTLLSTEIKEAINHIRKDIETSAKNGQIGKLYTKSVMRTLNKWEKRISGI